MGKYKVVYLGYADPSVNIIIHIGKALATVIPFISANPACLSALLTKGINNYSVYLFFSNVFMCPLCDGYSQGLSVKVYHGLDHECSDFTDV